jgi:hypothetical protein
LVDGGELTRQGLVEVFNDPRISLHATFSSQPLQ